MTCFNILQVAYDAMEKPKRELLSRLAAFRSPMSYEALVAQNPFKNEERFDQALERERIILARWASTWSKTEEVSGTMGSPAVYRSAQAGYTTLCILRRRPPTPLISYNDSGGNRCCSG